MPEPDATIAALRVATATKGLRAPLPKPESPDRASLWDYVMAIVGLAGEGFSRLWHRITHRR